MNFALPATIRHWLSQILEELPLNLQIDFWGQIELSSASDRSPAIRLRVNHPGVLKNVFLSQDPLCLVDAYLEKWIDVEGDLATVIAAVQQHPHAQIDRWQAFKAWLASWRLPDLPVPLQGTAPWMRLRFHTPDRDRAAVQHHYDTGNAFYRVWLDPHMVYSCAYFEHPQMTLQEAQEAKLDRICRKLKLSAGETLLDIGCGWGALLRWAVTRYGVKAHGITLSDEQLAHNQQQIDAAGLGDAVTVELLDYRALPPTPTFDKIVSIGMVEHVGTQNYPAYFERALAALRPGGLFLNHGIATSDAWNGTSLGERFIDRYIFPDGRLTQLSTQLTAAEAAGWEIVDVDAWRLHYAKTLRCWASNFDAAFDQVAEQIGERRSQLWRLYLLGSARGFETNQMGIYQTVLRRRADSEWNLPTVRANWLC